MQLAVAVPRPSSGQSRSEQGAPSLGLMVRDLVPALLSLPWVRLGTHQTPHASHRRDAEDTVGTPGRPHPGLWVLKG